MCVRLEKGLIRGRSKWEHSQIVLITLQQLLRHKAKIEPSWAYDEENVREVWQEKKQLQPLNASLTVHLSDCPSDRVSVVYLCALIK